MSESVVKIHVFERAGLGIAPFDLVGSYEAIYQAIPGDPNCPIQPGTCCDYCGQGIRYVAKVRSADGREFKVGWDCARRTGDGKLVRAADLAERRRDAAKRASKAVAVKSELDALLADESVRETLASLPHPRERAGESMLDHVEWMVRHAGAAGRAKVLKAIRAAIEVRSCT